MTQHTINGYIVYETWNREKGKYRFQEYAAITNGQDYTQVPVCKHSITFDMPEGFDPRPAQVAALKKKKQEIRAAFAVAVKELDDQIASLLAIENNATEVA